MITKRFWGPALRDRRAVGRHSVDLYAVELARGARYLHRISNISDSGMLLEDRLQVLRPGGILELELPRSEGAPVRLKAEVVRVSHGGRVGLRAIEADRLAGVGGTLDL